ncbi:Ubiquitin carboxyl-terminal hydrolase and/or F-box protein [Phytophthora cinnamomi]|uniref:Ubiquitin carboxyl-terminal hydrolase and/or F-box protein n=1 Tax=Phytophthora cinnamomi TaxID=4785 RepID=UPI00355A5BC1|nr:Ubiquitin carboxyl-terminal hydrolase and/or F-box protein [Phytophthora cinnamomi]
MVAARALSPKKRQWLGGATSPPSSKSSRRAQHPRLERCRAGDGSAGETDNESLDLEDVDMDEAPKASPAGDIQTLPDELLALALAQLDGRSLLACAATCRAFRSLTFDREVWKRLCVKQWPTLRTQLLPQLPGAPDYDLVRLYGGCWRRCFLEKHAKEQRAEISVKVPNFSDVEAMRDVDKVVSDMFTIGEHRFCLWVFPNGNPNEAQYKGRVLSVYLVLTDLSRRPPDWLTCAVFSLQVENALDPRRRLEWHSCLTDNKFHKHLNNWGVHSLGSLGMLRDPQQGFLTKSAEGRAEPDTLTVSAQVRLMTITFRVVFEHDLREHHHLGLVDFSNVAELELPFCCSLRDLQVALHEKFLEVLGEYNEDESAMNQTRVWCFNQPVVSGQALRPRKLLTCDKAQQDRPLFGHLLCDGVDIDAYSFCQIYVEDNSMANDLPLDLPSSDLATAKDLKVAPEGYVFVKLLQPAPLNRLEYVGKVCIFDASSSKDIDMQNYSESGKLAPSVLYEAVAQKTGWSCAQLQMYREEIAPTVLSDVIPYHTSAVTAGLQPADIVVFIVRPEVPRELMTPRFRNPLFDLLLERYAEAWQLFNSDGLSLPTLEHVENLAEKLDIPKFRVRSAFRKCHEDAIATLRYIMEGRHLGFICDSCGETDFTGARYNCAVCSDYDLCAACNAKSCEISHRYANVEGKWQRVYNFKDHKTSHTMRKMLPVFYGYDRKHQWRQGSRALL